MKRIIAAIISVVMLFTLCACGGTNTETNPATADKSSSEENLDIKSDEDSVDIYLAIIDSEEIGAEAYLENLKAENPENEYRYYNEHYYIQTLTEGERKAIQEQMKDPDVFFKEMFETDYPGMFIKAELSEGMDELTLHLNREAFESNFFARFVILNDGAAYLDSVQAYDLVSPENRGSRLLCVDENGEVLMDSEETEDSTEEAPADSAIAQPEYSTTDYVVVDNENFTFTIKSMEADGDWSFTFKVFCQNKTDKNLTFSWDKVSVMGFTQDPFWSSEIAAGKMSNEEIRFSCKSLDKNGVDTIDDITFTLRVSDSEDLSADPLLVEEFAFYPMENTIQESTSSGGKSGGGEVALHGSGG